MAATGEAAEAEAGVEAVEVPEDAEAAAGAAVAAAAVADPGANDQSHLSEFKLDGFAHTSIFILIRQSSSLSGIFGIYISGLFLDISAQKLRVQEFFTRHLKNSAAQDESF